MIPLTAAQIAHIVGGTLADAPDADRIIVNAACADSRAATPGSLFVAIAGERVNGHDFVEAARGLGAVLSLTSRPVGSPAVVVADPVTALGILASHTVRQLPDTVVLALTGSSGKTTTKDLLADILRAAAPTVAPSGSFNTEVGLPLTVLECDESTRFLVLEMGMRGLGHIAYLCELARPSIGALLNVGSAHLEMLGSREGIAQAKGEIVESLPADGVAVLQADDPLVMAQASRTTARVVTFGESPAADVRASDVRLDGFARPSFTVTHDGESLPVHLQLSGEHQVANALGATAMALAAGLPLSDIVRALDEARPRSRWRMEVSERADGVIVINDAYNANPESMRAALKSLAAIGRGKRTWAVLGEMREIGSSSVEEHDAIGRLAVRLDINRLIAVGEGARPIHLGASHEGSWGNESAWVPDAPAALDVLRGEIEPGDVILVKASRSIGLDEVATTLLREVMA